MNIGDLLLNENLITKDKILIAQKVQKQVDKSLIEILQNLDFVTSFDIAKVLSKQYNIEFIDLSNIVLDKNIIHIIDEFTAKEYKVIIVSKEDNYYEIATSNTNIMEVKDLLGRLNISDYKLLFCDEFLLKNLQHYYYNEIHNPIDKQIEDLISKFSFNKSLDLMNFFQLVLESAINKNATDIHFSSNSLSSSISFRIDGIIHMFYSFPYELHNRLVSTIKVKSNMDIANSNLPQDGTMKITYIGDEYDFRVSSVPTSYSENIVIRVLPKNSSLFNLNNLGFNNINKEKLEKYFLKPYGIVLIVGPTGSGKTTTLYSALRKINAVEKNILTIEDPIEYSFSFIKQTQVNNQAGYTFHKALRHFMRQDPDVILVGEIRDEETASLAVRASITGHLVLSTIHANSAIDALPRLYDLKVDPALLSLSLLSVVGQRLIKKLCPKCKEELNISKEELLKDINYPSKNQFENKNLTIFKASKDGCSTCNFTGYKGRVAIIEIFEIDETIKRMLIEKRNISDISQEAFKLGMKSIKDDALDKILEGITSIDEINRVLN